MRENVSASNWQSCELGINQTSRKKHHARAGMWPEKLPADQNNAMAA
jgi:hypothetical protein